MEDFTLTPQLTEALQRPIDGRPLYELVVPSRPIVEDLSVVPAEATFVATRGTATHLERFASLPGVVAAWANPASPALFRQLASSPKLRAVYVGHFRKLAAVDLRGATSLQHLLLDWAPQLVDLSFLEPLPALRTLYLESMKRLDLTTLPRLPDLLGLHIGGGMWDTLKLPSLAPLRNTPALRHLTLSNVRPLDGSLQPLAGLSHLRALHLPNFFVVEEFARLAAALPNTISNVSTPFFGASDGASGNTSLFQCPECGGARQMMTGKPAAILCSKCDASRIQKRVARWEAARASRWLM